MPEGKDMDELQRLGRILRAPFPEVKRIRIDPTRDLEEELLQRVTEMKAEATARKANWLDPEPWLYEDGCRERVPVHEGTEDHDKALYRPRTYEQYKLERL